jgi:hypothetical protein
MKRKLYTACRVLETLTLVGIGIMFWFAWTNGQVLP